MKTRTDVILPMRTKVRIIQNAVHITSAHVFGRAEGPLSYQYHPLFVATYAEPSAVKPKREKGSKPNTQPTRDFIIIGMMSDDYLRSDLATQLNTIQAPLEYI